MPSSDPKRILDRISRIGSPKWTCRPNGPHSKECGLASELDECSCGCNAYEHYCDAQIDWHKTQEDLRRLLELRSLGVITDDEIREKLKMEKPDGR